MKPVLFCSPYIPPEWIAAHGLIPSRILPACSAHADGVDISLGVCPFARGFIIAVLHTRDITAALFTTTCDQMRRGADYVAQRSHIPCFLMHVPATWQNSAAHALYGRELQRLSNFLLEVGGDKPDQQDLIDIMLYYDDMRRKICSSRPCAEAMEFAQSLAQFYQTNKWSLQVSRRKPPAQGIPLLLLGGPFIKDDLSLLDLIEMNGGRIALDASESGLRTFPAPFQRRKIRKNPPGELVEAYFGSIVDAFRRPNSELYNWLKPKIHEYGIEGIVIHRYVWCDIWHGEVQRLREWAELPILDICRGDEENHTQNRTEIRIQAFMETLRSKHASSN